MLDLRPEIAWALPAAIDSYVLAALHTRRDVPAAITVMTGALMASMGAHLAQVGRAGHLSRHLDRTTGHRDHDRPGRRRLARPRPHRPHDPRHRYGTGTRYRPSAAGVTVTTERSPRVPAAGEYTRTAAPAAVLMPRAAPSTPAPTAPGPVVCGPVHPTRRTPHRRDPSRPVRAGGPAERSVRLDYDPAAERRDRHVIGAGHR